MMSCPTEVQGKFVFDYNKDKLLPVVLEQLRIEILIVLSAWISWCTVTVQSVQLLLIQPRSLPPLGWMSAVKISANKNLSNRVASVFSNWKAESFQNAVTTAVSG